MTSIPRHGFFAAMALLPCSADVVSAHAQLKTATPEPDSSSAAAPSEIRLGFTERINLKFTGSIVTGPAGALVSISVAKLAPDDDEAIVVPVSGPLGPGRYRIDWHALATDGHRTNGSYGFDVRP